MSFLDALVGGRLFAYSTTDMVPSNILDMNVLAFYCNLNQDQIKLNQDLFPPLFIVYLFSIFTFNFLFFIPHSGTFFSKRKKPRA